MNEIVIVIMVFLCIVIGVLRYREMQILNDISAMEEIIKKLKNRDLTDEERDIFNNLETWEEKLKYIKTLPKT